MEIKIEHIRKRIIDHKLRVTPQRVAVLEALINMRTHPTAYDVIKYLKVEHPNISVGTVYNTLETFTKNGVVKKVKADREIMRYDAFTDKHFHLYCENSNRIEDYYDIELNQLIKNYFENKKINNFEIDEVQIQLNGRFTDSQNK